MEVFTSFTDDNTSTKEMGAENPSFSQEWNSNPETQWVQTLCVTSQEIRCSFLHNNRAEWMMSEQRQGLKGKEYSAQQSWVVHSQTMSQRPDLRLRQAQMIFIHINYIAPLCTVHNVLEYPPQLSTLYGSPLHTSEVLSAQTSIEKSQTLSGLVMEQYAHSSWSLEHNDDQKGHT